MKNNNEKFLGEMLLESLPKSEDDAIHLYDLASKLGMNSRDVKTLVQCLRQKGYPICSSTYAGYWLADTEEDFLTTIRQLQSRIRTMLDTVEALTKTYDEWRKSNE